MTRKSNLNGDFILMKMVWSLWQYKLTDWENEIQSEISGQIFYNLIFDTQVWELLSANDQPTRSQLIKYVHINLVKKQSKVGFHAKVQEQNYELKFDFVPSICLCFDQSAPS